MAAPFTLRGVIVLWSGITLVYLVAVTHRLLWLHTPPGLATFAAVSAVLGRLARVVCDPVWARPSRAGFAVLLLIVLFWKNHNLVDRFNRKARNDKRITH